MFISISPSETLRDIYKEMESATFLETITLLRCLLFKLSLFPMFLKSEESYSSDEILEGNIFRSKHYILLCELKTLMLSK